MNNHKLTQQPIKKSQPNIQILAYLPKSTKTEKYEN